MEIIVSVMCLNVIYFNIYIILIFGVSHFILFIYVIK